MSIIIYKNGKFSSPYSNAKQMSGEKIPGDLKTWDYFGTDPNEILRLHYDVLSQRSTTLFHTHPQISSAIQKTTMYAIGSGLVYRSQPDWRVLGMSKESANEWSIRFQKLVHYAFQILNFYEKQSVLFRTGLIMGDSLLFFSRVRPKNGMPFDLIETGGDQINFQAQESTLGIIHDSMLRGQGIVLVNGKRVKFVNRNNDQNVIQFYNKQMGRQLRGYPLAYKIIALAKNYDRLWDSTVARAALESIMFGVSKTENEDTAQQARNMGSQVRNESGVNPNSGLTQDGNVANLGVGGIFSLKTDSSIEFTDLKTPSNNFDKLHDAYNEMIGMATDVPPEVMISKYSTSYTAHKGAMNDFIKSYKQKRDLFIDNVGMVVVKELAKYFFMEGLIEMPNAGFFDNAVIQQATIAGNWLGPIPGHINPLQEVNAKQKRVENAFTLRSQEAAEEGNEYDTMIVQWHDEEQRFNSSSDDEQAQIISDDLEDQEDEE